MGTIKKALMFGVLVLAMTTGAVAEQVDIPADFNGSVATEFPSISGQSYVITVSGTYGYNDSSDYKIADAEWVQVKIDEKLVWVETPSGGDLDLYVNGVDISMMGTEDGKTFSRHVYSDSHTYKANILGTGEPIRFSIYDRNHDDNSGDLHVKIESGWQDVTVVHQMGDTDVNGVVDGYDCGNLVDQLGGSPGDESADFNGDGVVDLYDFSVLRENFGLGSASAPTGESGATAPEPATLILMASGLPLLLTRRRLRLTASVFAWRLGRDKPSSRERKSC